MAELEVQFPTDAEIQDLIEQRELLRAEFAELEPQIHSDRHQVSTHDEFSFLSSLCIENLGTFVD